MAHTCTQYVLAGSPVGVPRPGVGRAVRLCDRPGGPVVQPELVLGTYPTRRWRQRSTAPMLPAPADWRETAAEFRRHRGRRRSRRAQHVGRHRCERFVRRSGADVPCPYLHLSTSLQEGRSCSRSRCWSCCTPVRSTRKSRCTARTGTRDVPDPPLAAAVNSTDVPGACGLAGDGGGVRATARHRRVVDAQHVGRHVENASYAAAEPTLRAHTCT